MNWGVDSSTRLKVLDMAPGPNLQYSPFGSPDYTGSKSPLNTACLWVQTQEACDLCLICCSIYSAWRKDATSLFLATSSFSFLVFQIFLIPELGIELIIEALYFLTSYRQLQIQNLWNLKVFFFKLVTSSSDDKISPELIWGYLWSLFIFLRMNIHMIL